jgi:hypothetical protein
LLVRIIKMLDSRKGAKVAKKIKENLGGFAPLRDIL